MATHKVENVRKEKMPEFWNCKLSKPVTCTLPVFPNRKQTEILQTARNTLTIADQCLSQQENLMLEYFVLNKLLYMKNGQLRSEKSFQGLKQIQSCLKRLFGYGLELVIKEFHSDFQRVVLQEGIRAYLPSHQMWEYLLTHFLGASGLLTNIASRCAVVFLHVHRHLTIGNLIPTNMVFLSMISRIWACCQALYLDLQTWYLDLLPVRDVLAATDFPWLPEGEILPDNLPSWLNEKGLVVGLHACKGEPASDDLALITEMYQQVKTSDSESADQTEALDQTLPVSMDETLPSFIEEDFGDLVSISDFELERRKEEKAEGLKPKKKKKGPAFAMLGIQKKALKAESINDLQLLLKRFNKKFPSCSTDKKVNKCAAVLADLASQSLTLQMKGHEKRAQKLLTRGRNKLLRCLQMSSQLKPFVTGPEKQQKTNMKKNPKKKSKDGVPIKILPKKKTFVTEPEKQQKTNSKKKQKSKKATPVKLLPKTEPAMSGPAKKQKLNVKKKQKKNSNPGTPIKKSSKVKPFLSESKNTKKRGRRKSTKN